MKDNIINKLNYWRNKAIKLQKELDKAMWDETFGIYSRFGINRIIKKWKNKTVHLLFIDLDHIHTMNDNLTYQVVDNKIKTAFNEIWKHLDSTDYLARHYSGDEILLTGPNDLRKHIDIVFKAFHRQGITLTAAYNMADKFSGKLSDLVCPASAKVQEAKRNNTRDKFIG